MHLPVGTRHRGVQARLPSALRHSGMLMPWSSQLQSFSNRASCFSVLLATSAFPPPDLHTYSASQGRTRTKSTSPASTYGTTASAGVSCVQRGLGAKIRCGMQGGEGMPTQGCSAAVPAQAQRRRPCPPHVSAAPALPRWACGASGRSLLLRRGRRWFHVYTPPGGT